jgi:hypothetical protein
MKSRSRSQAQAGNVAGIRRNFRFNKHDMEHRSRLPHPHSMGTTDQAPIAETSHCNIRNAAPTEGHRIFSSSAGGVITK